MYLDRFPRFPYGLVAFCIFALGLTTIGLKLLWTNSRSHNPLGPVHAAIVLGLAGTTLGLGLPFLLTENYGILLYSFYASFICLSVAFVAMLRIIWFDLLRNRIRFSYIVLPVIICCLVILFTDLRYTSVSFNGGDLAYHSSQLTLRLKALLYVIVPLPFGYIYLRQINRARELRSKLKFLGFGATICIISLLAASENIRGTGKSDLAGEIVRFALSLVVLAISIWPRRTTAVNG